MSLKNHLATRTMENKEIEILKVLVGSQAHGLANEKSDFDFRAVFVTPTSELLKIGAKPKTTSWIEGKEDNTAWEIGHFLHMAVHCNPTILEVFLAPRTAVINLVNGVDWGKELRALFPHVWNSKGVLDAFVGYGINQRKKFLEDKDGRQAKYAVAYLRTLMQAKELLDTGTFTMRIADYDSPFLVGKLKEWKAGNFKMGEVIQICTDMEKSVRYAYDNNPKKETNIEPINDFLLRLRKDIWE